MLELHSMSGVPELLADGLLIGRGYMLQAARRTNFVTHEVNLIRPSAPSPYTVSSQSSRPRLCIPGAWTGTDNLGSRILYTVRCSWEQSRTSFTPRTGLLGLLN